MATHIAVIVDNDGGHVTQELKRNQFLCPGGIHIGLYDAGVRCDCNCACCKKNTVECPLYFVVCPSGKHTYNPFGDKSLLCHCSQDVSVVEKQEYQDHL